MRTDTKLAKARELYNKYKNERPMDVIALFIRALDMSEGTASGYYYSIKKEHDAQTSPNKLLEKFVQTPKQKQPALAQRDAPKRGRPPAERKILEDSVKARGRPRKSN